MGRILLRIPIGDISGAEEIEGLGVEDKMRLQEDEATNNKDNLPDEIQIKISLD